MLRHPWWKGDCISHHNAQGLLALLLGPEMPMDRQAPPPFWPHSWEACVFRGLDPSGCSGSQSLLISATPGHNVCLSLSI